jgi:hypothetical protein
MAKFCPACGTRNDDAAGFCGECGKALRPASLSAARAPSHAAPADGEGAAAPAAPAGRPSWLLPAVVGAATLIVAGGGIAWWWSPPAASTEAFASALKGASGAAAMPSVDLLCLANLPYDRPQINADERDLNMRRWMDTLASAGLYTAGQPVQGVFQQLIQYTPTPELANWRRGARLCVAKSWSLGEVKASRFTPEKRGERTFYRASVVWKAQGGAPWLPEVSARQVSPGVRLEAGSLTTESTHLFEIRDRHWVVVTAADRGQSQRDVVQASRGGATSNAATVKQGGIFSAVMDLFRSSAAHPLVGEWAIEDSSPLGLFGAAIPFKDGRVTFGNEFMETGGERIDASFEVNGDVVNVRAQGDTDGIPFKMKDRNRMAMGVGLVEIPFKRVK